MLRKFFRQIAEDQEAIYRPSVCGDNCLKASIILIFDITLLPYRGEGEAKHWGGIL